MFSKFLNKHNKKIQNRNELKNIYGEFYLNANKLNENALKHVSQSKRIKRSDCFIQEDTSNFLIIPKSRNPKCGIIHDYCENN